MQHTKKIEKIERMIAELRNIRNEVTTESPFTPEYDASLKINQAIDNLHHAYLDLKRGK